MPGGFSLIDLQAFSGHRDTRMLLRYTHLCMPSLAQRLDLAFKGTEPQDVTHRGRRRLKKGMTLTVGELVREAAVPHTLALPSQETESVSPNVLLFRRRVA